MSVTNWENEKKILYNWGILPVDDVPNSVIDYLKSNISDYNYNYSLAGHMKEEYNVLNHFS